jgi:hypothetical protein
MFLSWCQKSNFTSTENHRQNCPLFYSNFYVLIQQTRSKNFLDEVVTSITQIFHSLGFFENQILIVTVVSKYLNYATFLKDLLANFMLRFLPVFWGKLQSSASNVVTTPSTPFPVGHLLSFLLEHDSEAKKVVWISNRIIELFYISVTTSFANSNTN